MLQIRQPLHAVAYAPTATGFAKNPAPLPVQTGTQYKLLIAHSGLRSAKSADPQEMLIQSTSTPPRVSPVRHKQ